MRQSALEDFPPSQRPPSKLIAAELLALAASSLLFPFGLRASRKRTQRRAEQRTTVLVHGYLGNRSAFFPLALYLKACGSAPLLSFSYSAANGIERAALELRDSLGRRVRGGRIDLVCHSLGGLIARTWLQILGGARRVDRCIMLGAPESGTYNAYWLTSRIGRELRPGSPLLRRLESTRAAASSVRFSSIVAGSDNIVIPRVSCAAEGEVVHVADVGHLGLLFSPTVFRAVHERLAAPAGRATGEAPRNVAALKAKIEGARRRLQAAENGVESALQQIGATPRAEKSIISGALSTAFAELKAARQELIDLQQVIAEEG